MSIWDLFSIFFIQKCKNFIGSCWYYVRIFSEIRQIVINVVRSLFVVVIQNYWIQFDIISSISLLLEVNRNSLPVYHLWMEGRTVCQWTHKTISILFIQKTTPWFPINSCCRYSVLIISKSAVIRCDLNLLKFRKRFSTIWCTRSKTKLTS